MFLPKGALASDVVGRVAVGQGRNRKMRISRRGFVKVTGSVLAGTVATKATPVHATEPMDNKLDGATVTTTVCPYCAVGCGQLVYVKNGKVIHIEGDAEHPVNEGALCSKGAALAQVVNNERRLDKVLYRAPGSKEWEEKEWDWALSRIAQKIRETRDATFLKDENGQTVNRTEGIACLGGAALDSEECYLYSKLARALGVAYLEHQARI